LKHTFSVSWLWITMIVAALINAATTGSFNVALPFLVKETLGGGAGILGTVMTFLGVGALLGGLFMGSIRFQRISRLGVTLYLLLFAMGVATLVIGAIPTVAVLIAMAFLLGFLMECFGVVWITLLQERVPSHLLGRVSSVDSWDPLPSSPSVSVWPERRWPLLARLGRSSPEVSSWLRCPCWGFCPGPSGI